MTIIRVLGDIAQEVLILYIMFQKFHQPFVVHIVKEASYIRFEYVVNLSVHDRLVDIPDYVMRTSTRPKSIGTVQKSRLIDVVQQSCHNSLDKPILVGRYAQRSHLRIHSKLTVNFKPANNVTPSFVGADILDIDQFELFIRNFNARYIFIPVCLTENLESCFCAC